MLPWRRGHSASSTSRFGTAESAQSSNGRCDTPAGDSVFELVSGRGAGVSPWGSDPDQYETGDEHFAPEVSLVCKLVTHVSHVTLLIGHVIPSVQRVVVESVTSAVTKEVQTAFEEYYKYSPAAKEEEEKKRKEEDMLKLVGEQQYNSAFELALSTSDLKIVMLLCSKVNPDLVFDKTPCPLSQPVLLSLIQQLSVDLQDQLELKIK